MKQVSDPLRLPLLPALPRCLSAIPPVADPEGDPATPKPPPVPVDEAVEQGIQAGRRSRVRFQDARKR